MRPPDAERRPDRGRRFQNLIKTDRLGRSESTARVRRAEDIAEQVAGIERALDSTDLVAIDAMSASPTYTPSEALEHVLAMHGGIRRRLGVLVVDDIVGVS